MTDKRGGYRFGYVTLLGKPNVGKSTLINTLLNKKISIVSSKPQTTRHKILAILTGDDYQIVFIDTPGIFAPKYMLHELMQKNAKEAAKLADILVYVIDASSPHQDELKLLPKFEDINVILAINKIDLIKKPRLLPLIDFYSKLYKFKEIILISALFADGVDRLLLAIKNNLPFSENLLYPKDFITDKPQQFFIEEFIREKIFNLCHKEVPYASSVKLEQMQENNKKLYIRAIIYIVRPTQRRILIGEGGGMIKKIGEGARVEIENFLKKKVYLDLYVKVKKDWYKDRRYLREFGYT